jgi:hypothetical protein
MPRKQLYLLVLLATAAGWLLVAWNWQYYDLRHLRSGLELCPFMHITGQPCPSCGSTHAVLHLFRFHFAEAFYANPFSYIIAFCMLVFPGWVLADIVTGKAKFYQFYHRAQLYLQRRWVAMPLIALVLVNWVWNLYKYNV